MRMAVKDLFSRPYPMINACGHVYIHSLGTLLIQYLVDHIVYEDGAMVMCTAGLMFSSIWINGITQDLLKQCFYSVKEGI